MSYGRFGVREICDVVFRPLSSLDIGNQHFDKMQPCLYLDTAQTSSLEGASTTVYAQGGKGNPRLIAWEGERTLTLNITDALMSTISFAMLSGAGVIESWEKGHPLEEGATDWYDSEEILSRAVFMHTTYDLTVTSVDKNKHEITVVLPKDVLSNDKIFVSKNAPVYAVALNSAGGIKSYLPAIKYSGTEKHITNDVEKNVHTITGKGGVTGTVFELGNITFTIQEPFPQGAGESGYQGTIDNPLVEAGDIVRIDCYTIHPHGATQMNIDAENFAGYYYIEADTLFRDEETGKDFPAEFVIPRGKIQSNFTFSLASSGDPSTFDFVIDCFPGYTSFSNKKVLAQLNVIDPSSDDSHPYGVDVHGHKGRTSDSDVEGFWNTTPPKTETSGS